MSPAMQAKLLRFLESHCFERVGESETRRSDVRVVSATNRDLREMVSAGVFREDLFYRLDVLRIELPALRDRPEDVPLLVAHFLSGRGEISPRAEISPEALAVLERYEWPGNVRELRNCLEHATALARGSGTIAVDHLPAHVVRASGAAGGQAGGLAASADRMIRLLARQRLAAAGEEGQIHAEAVRIAERAVIAEVLAAVGGNQVQASKRLGMHRTTLRKKIEEYGLAGP
jgi:transcriptional regulator with PAS, ATPase and Fis domain